MWITLSLSYVMGCAHADNSVKVKVLGNRIDVNGKSTIQESIESIIYPVDSEFKKYPDDGFVYAYDIRRFPGATVVFRKDTNNKVSPFLKIEREMGENNQLNITFTSFIDKELVVLDTLAYVDVENYNNISMNLDNKNYNVKDIKGKVNGIHHYPQFYDKPTYLCTWEKEIKISPKHIQKVSFIGAVKALPIIVLCETGKGKMKFVVYN